MPIVKTTIIFDNSHVVSGGLGRGGGYSLARPPQDITVADVMRAIDGQVANVRGMRPE